MKKEKYKFLSFIFFGSGIKKLILIELFLRLYTFVNFFLFLSLAIVNSDSRILIFSILSSLIMFLHLYSYFLIVIDLATKVRVYETVMKQLG